MSYLNFGNGKVGFEMNYTLKGSGARFNTLNEKLNNSSIIEFQSFTKSDFSNEEFVIWVGEGEPDPNTTIWIKKTKMETFESLIFELRACFNKMPNLRYVGVDNYNQIKISPDMCVLVSRQNSIMTFQNPEDLNNYILDLMGANNF